MKQAAQDTETAKSMPAPEGGIKGAIAGFRHGRALKKAAKLDARGQALRDKGEAMGPRKVDKAAVRARIDAKLADIRKRRGLAQQAQVDRPSTRDARPQQHGVQPNIPGPKPKAATKKPKSDPVKREAPLRGLNAPGPVTVGKKDPSPEEQVSGGLKPSIRSTRAGRRFKAGVSAAKKASRGTKPTPEEQVSGGLKPSIRSTPATRAAKEKGSLASQMSGSAKSKRHGASDRLRISGVRRKFGIRKAKREAGNNPEDGQ